MPESPETAGNLIFRKTSNESLDISEQKNPKMRRLEKITRTVFLNILPKIEKVLNSGSFLYFFVLFLFLATFQLLAFQDLGFLNGLELSTKKTRGDLVCER